MVAFCLKMQVMQVKKKKQQKKTAEASWVASFSSLLPFPASLIPLSPNLFLSVSMLTVSRYQEEYSMDSTNAQ